MNTEIRKTAGTLTEAGGTEDMALINRLSRKELKAEEVYTFAVRLCDNDIDRDFERFDRKALEKLGELFLGKSGIFDHQWSAKGQSARLYKTEVCGEEGLVAGNGEKKCFLKGWAYMLRCDSNKDLIAEIEAGIKKEVSVGCAVEKRLCSICGKEAGQCGHVAGRRYGGKLCYITLMEPTDAYEWSFVAVPAQRRAGVVKGLGQADCLKSLAAEDPVLKAELEELESQAALGRRYLEELRGEVVRLMGLADRDMDRELLCQMSRRLELEELLGLRKAYRSRVEKLWPASVQLAKREMTAEISDGGAFLV